MAIYYCSECCERINNDYEPMDEHGRCPECAAELGETPEQRQKGVFTQAQLDIIKKLEMESDDEG